MRSSPPPTTAGSPPPPNGQHSPFDEGDGKLLSLSSFTESLSRYPKEHALPFLANVPSGSHLALFWEEADAARLVEFWYILHGLVREEHCIYTTHGDTTEVRAAMQRRGLDVEYYEDTKGLLHIVQIEDPMNDPEGLTNGVSKVVQKIFANTKPPYRIVSRWIRAVDTEEGKRANMEVEVMCHMGYLGKLPRTNPYSMFRKFQGSMICHYPINTLSAKTHNEWVRNHLSAHHVAIFVPSTTQMSVVRLG